MKNSKAEKFDAGYIRNYASESFVKQAKAMGVNTFSIPVREVLTALTKKGLPAGRTPAICSALRREKFQIENGIQYLGFDGPPSGVSPTVVLHFSIPKQASSSEHDSRLVETPEQRAFRLAERLRGLMKDEIATHGGAEGYLRWVRGEDEEDAA